MKSSTSIKPSTIQRKWHVIDMRDQILGRASTQVAKLLIGKHKPYYVPHQDTGDYVVVINARHIKTTGNKLAEKIYYRHSGFPGGLKTRTMQEQMEKDPCKVVEHAIRGMLPKTRLGENIFAKLFIYADETHPYESRLNASKPRIDKKKVKETEGDK